MNAGVVIALICALIGAIPLSFGLLTGAMPPTPRRAFFDGPAHRDEKPTDYWLNGAFYALILAFGCYRAFVSW